MLDMTTYVGQDSITLEGGGVGRGGGNARHLFDRSSALVGNMTDNTLTAFQADLR